jgi:hypothetical protein
MTTSHKRDGEYGLEITIVLTRAGYQPHLALLDDPYVTFCGLDAHFPSPTWFGLIGCRRCSASARKKGIAAVTDIDGDMCLI